MNNFNFDYVIIRLSGKNVLGHCSLETARSSLKYPRGIL